MKKILTFAPLMVKGKSKFIKMQRSTSAVRLHAQKGKLETEKEKKEKGVISVVHKVMQIGQSILLQENQIFIWAKASDCIETANCQIVNVTPEGFEDIVKALVVTAKKDAKIKVNSNEV